VARVLHGLGKVRARISSFLALSIDLRYHFITVRSLGFGILLVFIEMPPGQGQINSTLNIDLIFFNRLLI